METTLSIVEVEMSIRWARDNPKLFEIPFGKRFGRGEFRIVAFFPFLTASAPAHIIS